jgi:hypothetical protein
MEVENLVTTSEAQETDNPQEQDIVPEATDEVTETLDEVTKERYKQQMEWSRKEVDRLTEIVLQTAIREASKDASTLLELHKQDPKLASKVADNFDWANTERGTYKAFLKQDATVSKSLSDDEIDALAERKAEEILAKKEHEKAITKAQKMFSKLDEDLQEEAIKRFNKLVGNQVLTEDDAIELAEMATLYVSKDKWNWDRYNNAVASFASTGVSKSKKPSWEDLVSVIRDGKIVLIPSNTL